MENLDHQFAEVSNQFSGAMYQKAIEGVNGNVVISPISILTAVSFLMFGASEKTLSQMKSSLKYDAIEEEKLKSNFQQLMQSFEGKNEVKMANKVYVMKNYSVKPKFNEIATKIFHSEAESINFAKSAEAAANINQWVESKTNNKIKDLFESDAFDGMERLLLINAIYFKDQWLNQFDPKLTRSDKFHKNKQDSVDVDFMTISGEFLYKRTVLSTAVQLPFKNSNISMVFILPHPKMALSDIESQLHEFSFSELSKTMQKEEAFVTIPKFKIEFNSKLNEPLKKMGMDRMFSEEAEFENLLDSTEPLAVSKAIHKAFIEVNEEGAEAAAATAILVANYCGSCGPKTFYANRPFLFALMQDSTVLFIGRKVE